MKKNYINPVVKVYNVTPAHIVCTSLQDNVRIKYYNDDEAEEGYEIL